VAYCAGVVRFEAVEVRTPERDRAYPDFVVAAPTGPILNVPGEGLGPVMIFEGSRERK
jgi:hypothetical protein